MKHEMETNTGSHPQSPVDAQAPKGGRFERFKRFKSSKGCESERGRRQASCEYESEEDNPSNPSNPLEPSELEARVRRDCRRSCRRNFWIELLKTASKIAGVVLAAFGLSSFNAED